ncbi:MAG: hypothetical protein A2X13_10215 [Bacteroidetes bacterium GWC2_33_15]|nr:MAG: hypothetical protein A2X10_02770 [Bacteroidetes bacterium GWA2_33_15]OFX48780.1 MAG: hypothetical protein A2X13_10215 [Bacteroidetes bacterium GWC2_33_15]OFX66022.1 MAG: hypothetical protein A2X15_11365 [Bacteroidetes bacterium GWB2_32_14]OFX68217.1 MAG: hypothetical protein A2X14_07530 [Bacteroidetes bacterium GWD2_33_33]HAN17993.1 hypothetical protein [Bacteroidales bacterium]
MSVRKSTITMKDTKILFQYEGFFSHSIVNKLIRDFYEINKIHKLPTSVFKKMLIVMIEILENNYKYVQSIQNELPEGINLPYIKISKIARGFEIESANPLKIEHVSLLENKIKEINEYNKVLLKEFYLKKLLEGVYIEKDTPGVGLIRIAKITHNKIKYSFKQIDNKFLNYTLRIKVYSNT